MRLVCCRKGNHTCHKVAGTPGFAYLLIRQLVLRYWHLLRVVKVLLWLETPYHTIGFGIRQYLFFSFLVRRGEPAEV